MVAGLADAGEGRRGVSGNADLLEALSAATLARGASPASWSSFSNGSFDGIIARYAAEVRRKRLSQRSNAGGGPAVPRQSPAERVNKTRSPMTRSSSAASSTDPETAASANMS